LELSWEHIPQHQPADAQVGDSSLQRLVFGLLDLAEEVTLSLD
jgi:hypothetical protein